MERRKVGEKVRTQGEQRRCCCLSRSDEKVLVHHRRVGGEREEKDYERWTISRRRARVGDSSEGPFVRKGQGKDLLGDECRKEGEKGY